MNYTVVVVTYNRIELLKECLECIDNQTRKFDKIVLVNNCSTDGTTDYLSQKFENRSDVILVTTSKNLGGSGGFELGVKSVPDDTDYVLLIDDDAMLDSGFLEEIDKCREDGVYAYSGTILTDNVIDTSHRRRLKNRILMTKKDVPVKEYENDSFMYDLSTFCGLLISKTIIDEIGLPKGDYFIWYDDTEYSLRVDQYTKIKNINSAHINHKTSMIDNVDLSWKSYYGYRNQIDVGKKYSKAPLIYLMYRYLYHQFRIIYYARLAKKNPKEPYYLNCMELHKAVIRDSISGKLGISEEFYPGKRLRG